MRNESTASDLMFRLGKLIETRPGVIERPDINARTTWNSNDRPLEGLELDCSVRALSAYGQHQIARARREMGPARWAALNAEWAEQPDELCDNIACGRDPFDGFARANAVGTGPVMNEARAGLRHSVTVPFAGDGG